MNNHIGSDFDDFLREEGILAEIEAAALKRALAVQIQQKISKPAAQSFQQGWQEALQAETLPISELWSNCSRPAPVE